MTKVMLKHFLGDVADRLFRRTEKKARRHWEEGFFFRSGFPSPKRIRLFLEDLGPSFVKLGQLMSSRADMFPPVYIEEFRKLQDRVPPAPFSEIKAVIERELKRPLSEVFADFAPASVAAASVAQVHQAELFTGEKTAVKIIRPGIARKIREDIEVMFYLAKKIERFSRTGRILAPTNLVREFERTILKELDMFVEAGSIEKFAHNFRDSKELYIPKVYWDYTTRSVLTMEHIDGIKLDQVDAMKARGIDPKEIAMIGLRSFSLQLMEFGFFHADPHPANTIVMYDGRVAPVDYGITGYLDEAMMLQIANLLLGFAEHDYDMILDALWEIGVIERETMELKGFQLDLKDVTEMFYGRTLSTISVKDVYDQIMQLVLKYRIRLPRNILLLLKTFIQTESLGKILGSDASLLEVTRPYAKKLIQRSFDPRKIGKTLAKDVRMMNSYLKSVPKFVHDILEQTAAGRQRLEIWHGGFRDLYEKVEKAVNRFTVAIVVCAAIIAASVVFISTEKIMVLNVRLFGIESISLTALLGLIGYGIATVLGIWLIISIIRSGRM